MITGSFKRWIGRFAAGALVLSGVSLGVAGPANAVSTPSVVGATLVTQKDIRPDETTYLGWHEGYTNAKPAYFVGWNGLHLGVNAPSQIINGLVETGMPGNQVITGTALGALITGATISVASGEVSAQVAVTTGTAGWGTLRPAVPASTSTQATLADKWMSSQTIGDVVKNTAMPLRDLLSLLNAQGNLRYSAFGFLAMTPAVVTSMTWDAATYNFGPLVTSIPVTSTVRVIGADIRPNEATYPGWHEGYTNASPAFAVKPDGLHIGDGANSQIINGLTTPIANADLRSLITSSQLDVVSGVVSFQVPLYFGAVPDFTTLRPAANAKPGNAKFALSDSWVSSRVISATATTPAIPAGAPVALGDLIDALEAHTSVQVLAFGVLAMNTEPSVVSSIDWNGVTYSFLASETQTKLSGEPNSVFGSPVKYTATVSTVSPAGRVPDGMVSFWADATELVPPVALTGGKATFTVTDLPMGASTITAKFQGSDSYLASADRASVTVTTAPTTIDLPGAVGTLVGHNVVLTATVASGAGAGVAAGQVEFSVNGGTATSVTLVGGKATFTATNVQMGITHVFAEYLGSSTHSASATVTDIAVAFPTATGTATQIYVTRVYRDLFGRNPDPAGLAQWVALLDKGTSRAAVANGITYSTEYRSGLISDSYAMYLGRTPEAAGMSSWLGAMSRGWTVSQMESGFLASAEYYAKSGDTDWAWVDQMYSDVLGRTPATSEVKFWVARLGAGSSRQQVSMGFLLSTEHLNTVVNDHYVDLLHRDLDPSGRATWVGILQAGGRDEAIIAGIVASAEYYSRS